MLLSIAKLLEKPQSRLERVVGALTWLSQGMDTLQRKRLLMRTFRVCDGGRAFTLMSFPKALFFKATRAWGAREGSGGSRGDDGRRRPQGGECL